MNTPLILWLAWVSRYEGQRRFKMLGFTLDLSYDPSDSLTFPVHHKPENPPSTPG